MTAGTVQNKQRAARVLLVEDNHGDVILTKRAFKDARIANEMTVATTGEEALRMLQQDGEYVAIALPDLVLLDLNLPVMSGQDVLQAVKGDARLKHIPVVILSSSHAERDVVRSYNLHANGYVVKPVNLGNFSEVARKLEQFWFTLVVMPDQDDVRNVS